MKAKPSVGGLAKVSALTLVAGYVLFLHLRIVMLEARTDFIFDLSTACSPPRSRNEVHRMFAERGYQVVESGPNEDSVVLKRWWSGWMFRQPSGKIRYVNGVTLTWNPIDLISGL